MSKVRVKLDYFGVQEFLFSAPVKEMLREYGERVLNNLPDDGKGYEMEMAGDKRPVVKVFATTPKTRIDSSKNNTLLKALGAARS